MYVAGARDNARAVIHALARGRATDGHAVLAAEKHDLQLHSDVCRDPASACALLVLRATPPLDPLTRLAALHARREGAHRFVLLVEDLFYCADHESDPFAQPDPDAVEREARALLHTLDIDGDAVPVVRALRSDHAADMRALLAELDDLPPFLAPDPLRRTPPALAVEAALLDLLGPQITAATRIEQVRTTLDETAVLRDEAGGSHVFGVPYLDRDEPVPRCAHCREPLACILQFDARDFPDVPGAGGVHVVLGCEACEAPTLVQYHPAPTLQRRRTDQPRRFYQRGPDVLAPALLRPGPRIWQLPPADVLADQHPYLAARLRALPGVDLHYRDIVRTLGLGPSCPHAGGHAGHTLFASPLAPPDCPVCHLPLTHLAQVQAFDWPHSLWACHEHPSSAAFLRHRDLAEEFSAHETLV